MRPRVFPAEDCNAPVVHPLWILESFNEAAGIPRGRPRTPVSRASAGTSFNEAAGIPRGRQRAEHHATLRAHASMRPRVFPAEDRHNGAMQIGERPASMRPRVFPAEDGPLATRCDPRRFTTGSREVARIAKNERSLTPWD